MKKRGVLILNLGTPDNPSVKDVRKYLREFLNDPRVIDIHWLKRLLLVNLIIVPFRAPKSAIEYQKLFNLKDGKSPLLTYGKNLKHKLNKLANNDFDVELAMRYGNPSMNDVLKKMSQKNYDELYIFPLYPQYASATSGSTIEKAFKIIKKWWVIPEIKVIGQFYNNTNYIDCIINRSKQFEISNYDHIVFSYHGLPERHVNKVYQDNTICDEHSCEEGINESNTHCYKATCYATTKMLAAKLALDPAKYTTCFQSRLGKTPWITPYADQTIKKLGNEGQKKILIFSPSFVADCLETIIEIGETYSNLFKENGGEKLDMVPSLNNEDDWSNGLFNIIKENIS